MCMLDSIMRYYGDHSVSVRSLLSHCLFVFDLRHELVFILFCSVSKHGLFQRNIIWFRCSRAHNEVATICYNIRRYVVDMLSLWTLNRRNSPYTRRQQTELLELLITGGWRYDTPLLFYGLPVYVSTPAPLQCVCVGLCRTWPFGLCSQTADHRAPACTTASSLSYSDAVHSSPVRPGYQRHRAIQHRRIRTPHLPSSTSKCGFCCEDTDQVWEARASSVGVSSIWNQILPREKPSFC